MKNMIIMDCGRETETLEVISFDVSVRISTNLQMNINGSLSLH